MKYTIQVLLLFVFISCSDQIVNQIDSVGFPDKTRLSDNSVYENEDFFVSNSDIMCYIKHKSFEMKNLGSDFDVDSIIPLYCDSTIPACYAINYNKGWELIAADKRAPVIIASGNTGSFIDNSENEAFNFWVKDLANDVSELQKNIGLNFTSDLETIKNMNQSVSFWKAITADQDFINEHVMETKSSPTAPDYPGNEYEGTWVYCGTSTIHSVIDSVSHLITTKWGNNSPYNQNFPTKSTGCGHAPAGCAAIATGQVLLYCHHLLNTPSANPLYVKYAGDIYNPQPTAYPDNLLTWSSILNNNGESVSAFLADIAMRMGMYFTDDIGYIYNYGLIVNVLSSNGINCNTGSYTSTDIMAMESNILNGQPCILIAYGTGGINGHAFIVDSYKYTVTRQEFYYEWVYSNPSTGILPDPPRATIYGDLVYQKAIQMNWGWYGLYDDVWFSPTGAWNVHNLNYGNNGTTKILYYNLTD